MHAKKEGSTAIQEILVSWNCHEERPVLLIHNNSQAGVLYQILLLCHYCANFMLSCPPALRNMSEKIKTTQIKPDLQYSKSIPPLILFCLFRIKLKAVVHDKGPVLAVFFLINRNHDLDRSKRNNLSKPSDFTLFWPEGEFFCYMNNTKKMIFNANTTPPHPHCFANTIQNQQRLHTVFAKNWA